MKRTKRSLTILVALLLAALMLPAAAFAATVVPRKTVTAPSIVRAAYPTVPVSVGAGRTRVSACLIDSTTYVPLRATVQALCDGKVAYNAATRTVTVTARGLDLCVTDGDPVLRVNGRCFYTGEASVILNDGTFYVPVRLLAKAFSADVTWDAGTRSVTVSAGRAFATSGDSFYNADDLYWLSRIISAESRGEPLIGQIAVGNVVLNRVASSQYPNSVYGVIFDRQYGVQFTPAANGTVYAAPTASAVTAAKLCLEGVTVSEKILYFYEPSIAASSWIGRNRPYVFSIGAHYFYG